MFELAPDLVALLALAAFLAGFVDAIAGGGGLIAMPALLLAGVPPVSALATNKLQGASGVGAAAFAYARAGRVDWRVMGLPFVLAVLAGAGGALVAHRIPDQALRLIMPVVLVGVALFFAFKRGLSDEDRHRRLGPRGFGLLVVPLLGAYDGFFGPGTGAFYMTAFVLLAGQGILRATAHTKVVNFGSNLGALAVFAQAGSIWWGVGLVMALAQIAGALLGARAALRIGARLIRPLLVGTATIMALRLLWQALAA